MTDQERKVMEMVLDALKTKGEHHELVYAAIEALRQALAQDEQEPVIDRRLKVKIGRQYGYALNEHWFYLQPADEYAEQALTKHSGISAPPSKPWVSLTDEEMEKATRMSVDELLDHIYENGTTTEGVGYRVNRIVKAIEAKLKEKNNG